jgi:hypothetical protein
VAREPIKRELQYDFGRARRPDALPFDVFEAFEKTTHIDQQTDLSP